MSQGLCWLASYPKSGNTWLRVLLTNLLSEDAEPARINSLVASQIASSRPWLDDVLGFDSADLYPQELLTMRPNVYQWCNTQASGLVFYKTHDANIEISDGVYLFPPDAFSNVVYVIRNPLDVAISFSAHMSLSIDKAIAAMNRHDYTLVKETRRSLNQQAEQPLLSWSQHVKSWVDNPMFESHVIRYEDMHAFPVKIFHDVASYLKIPICETTLARAIRNSSFNILRNQENAERFTERPVSATAFFRRGVAGSWSEVLKRTQIERIIEDHHEVMKRFSYIDEQNQPQEQIPGNTCYEA